MKKLNILCCFLLLFFFLIFTNVEAVDDVQINYITSDHKTDWEVFAGWIGDFAISPAIELPRCKANSTIMSVQADGEQIETCIKHEAIPGWVVMIVAFFFVVYLFKRAFIDDATKS